MAWLRADNEREWRWPAVVLLGLSAIPGVLTAYLSIFLGDGPDSARQWFVPILFNGLFFYPAGAVGLALAAGGLFLARQARLAWGVLTVGWIWGGSIVALVAGFIVIGFGAVLVHLLVGG